MTCRVSAQDLTGQISTPTDFRLILVAFFMLFSLTESLTALLHRHLTVAGAVNWLNSLPLVFLRKIQPC